MKRRKLSKWFARTAKWFALFVRSGSESRVIERLRSQLNPDKYAVFTPTIDVPQRLRGNITSKKTVCFTGYVFIATTEDVVAFYNAITPIIAKDKHIYKLLVSSEPEYVSNEDRAILTALLNEEFNIAKVEAVELGDRVVLTDGRFVEISSAVIKSVNRHLSTAVIEFEVFGKRRTQTVMLEMLELVESQIID